MDVVGVYNTNWLDMAPASLHGSTPASPHGSTPLSLHGSMPASPHGSTPLSLHGSTPAGPHGSTPLSLHRSTPAGPHGSTPLSLSVGTGRRRSVETGRSRSVVIFSLIHTRIDPWRLERSRSVEIQDSADCGTAWLGIAKRYTAFLSVTPHS